MTKAELKKKETQEKLSFFAKAYGVVLSSIAEQTEDVRSKVEIRIIQQNFNRYIRFHRYGQDMAIKIFRDGKVVLELKEALHSDHEEQLFDYSVEAEDQAAFLDRLKDMLSWLIRVYLGMDVLDYHSYMDYVSATDNAEAAYRKMHEEYGR